MVVVVFLFAYGVAVQSLLYPNSHEDGPDILYKIFYYPYLSMFQNYDSYLNELEGKQLYTLIRSNVCFLSICL